MTRAVVALLVVLSPVLAAEPSLREVVADPSEVKLSGLDARIQLLLHGKDARDIQHDLTRAASYRSEDERVARVNERGVVEARGDGKTVLVVTVADRSLRVPVTVADSARPRAFHFENDVVPLLSRHGCNASGCHGKAEGQNGFKLSVFGFDPRADHAALVSEARGRRINPAAPEQSLLLRKAAGRSAHGGGVRLRPGSADYRTLLDWIAAGAPYGKQDAPRVVGVRIEPSQRVLNMESSQQLRVMARDSTGRQFDVTHHARFQSNHDGLASVDADGLVRSGRTPGSVAVMASYLGHLGLCQVLVPRPADADLSPLPAGHNFIDRLVHARLDRLNLRPSELCDDATFLRRVYLDLIGLLPTADEARAFLADTRPERRARLVDALLQRPEFADLWALPWADALRVDRQVLGHKNAFAYYKWVRDGIATGQPLDTFARELLTADGPLTQSPAGNFYKVAVKPGDRAAAVAQVFLGVRIACAECHHHPFDRWSQTDYQGLAAFFAQVGVRKGPRGEVVLAEGDPVTLHPRTGEKVFAHPLGATQPDRSPEGDRRETLARWLTAPDNPFFARSLANRIWAQLLGRGLVEPVDDVRLTNPPSNPELLDALAEHLVKNKYDLRALVRTITASRTYQLATTPNATNQYDEQNYSRAGLRRPPAEVLLDMVCQVTGVEEKFDGVPQGTRAVQLWDSKANHYFLKIFGRPMRVTNCACERQQGPSVAQVLHLLNGPEIQAKVQHAGGRIARLVKDNPDDATLVEQIYLTFFSRRPDTREQALALDYLRRSAGRRQGAEDLAWALLNSLEFSFNH